MNKVPDVPPPMNQAFCDWLMAKTGVHPLIAMEINRYIRKEFGQFNEHSALQEETRPHFVMSYFFSDHGASGPEQRIETDKPGLKALTWRTLGALFSKPKWVRRGVNYRFEKVVGATFSREVRMIRVGHSGAPDPFRNPIPQFSIQVGYEPLTDTLYVHPEVMFQEQRLWMTN